MATRTLTPLYHEPDMPRWWDRLVVLCTVLAIALLLVDMGLDPASMPAEVLRQVDLGFCALFIIDFAWRFVRAHHRWRFVKRNWIDLLGAIPLVGPLRAARVVRLVRLARFTRIAALGRRLLRRTDLTVPARRLGWLTVVTLGVWAGAAALFFQFEYGHNDSIADMYDALWWSMTTLSTVGYGDLYPVTTGGRVVAVVTMVCGIGVLGTLAATIASGFVDLRERARRGKRRYRMKDHLLVLGWNDKSFTAIDDFRHDPRYLETKVCIVADLPETPLEGSEVRFVRGKPYQAEPLDRANAARAAAAMVFAADPTDPRSDHETALTVQALRRLSATMRITAELISPENRPHLEAAGCDSVVDTRTLAATLIVRSTQDIGVSDVIEELLSNKIGAELYRVALPDRYHEMTYRDLAMDFVERGYGAIGIARGKKIMLGPDPGLRLTEDDDVFLVSEDPPRL